MAKSKSAYSIPGKKGKLDTHIIVVWVDNEAGKTIHDSIADIREAIDFCISISFLDSELRICFLSNE